MARTRQLSPKLKAGVIVGLVATLVLGLIGFTIWGLIFDLKLLGQVWTIIMYILFGGIGACIVGGLVIAGLAALYTTLVREFSNGR